MSFEAFPKIPRHKKTVVVTEKIDGTNAQVMIVDKVGLNTFADFDLSKVVYENDRHMMFAGSRSRWIVPGDDNFAFALWVSDNATDLINLGPGRHYGEWWGNGVQRGYGLDERRFSLFNTGRWCPSFGELSPGAVVADGATVAPACCHVVPVLYNGESPDFGQIMYDLHWGGSQAAPGFMNPEGIVIYHTASRQMYKQTFEMDAGKWTQEVA